MPVTSRQPLATILSATLPFMSSKQKKKPQQTGEAKPRQINKIFLMLSQSLLQRSLPAMSDKSNFSKAKEPNEGNCKVKKRQLSPRSWQKAFPMLFHSSALSYNPLHREGQRENRIRAHYVRQLSRTQTNHGMNKALEPKDEQIFGISNPKP